ncbi:DUF6409 family protein (plasmid) [Nocardiopsis exhalans]|uniref:DUF6409 family protein n=1 Tax=Nocardiopsis exhalans TaxID=163604 RepID=A0ABY5DJR7_9ACTN|nr:DUF6409 family protein [Nocardiopsis exhalans]USY23603.1 DUF6409 family protein [Nocardiopsis exhalans]
MTNTATQAPAAGQFVLAHVWSNGSRSETAKRGVVLGPWFTIPENSHQLIWFPEMGAPAAGESVQPIEDEHIIPTWDAAHLDSAPVAQVAEYHRQISEAPTMGQEWERVRADVLPMLESRLQERADG